jgi:hypothetical protein
MKDDRDHCQNQKDVDKESRDMKDEKSAQPQQKQDNSETKKHKFSPRQKRVVQDASAFIDSAQSIRCP